MGIFLLSVSSLVGVIEEALFSWGCGIELGRER